MLVPVNHQMILGWEALLYKQEKERGREKLFSFVAHIFHQKDNLFNIANTKELQNLKKNQPEKYANTSK